MSERDVADVGHWYGGDLLLSTTGDLARVTRVDRSRQRVLRRLLTSKGGYMSHPGYGAGLPLEIGANVDVARIRGIMRSQMLLEASVSPTPEPSIDVSAMVNGITADISYEVAPEQIPARLAFDAESE